jgi:hypothetical protein
MPFGLSFSRAEKLPEQIRGITSFAEVPMEWGRGPVSRLIVDYGRRFRIVRDNSYFVGRLTFDS